MPTTPNSPQSRTEHAKIPGRRQPLRDSPKITSQMTTGLRTSSTSKKNGKFATRSLVSPSRRKILLPYLKRDGYISFAIQIRTQQHPEATLGSDKSTNQSSDKQNYKFRVLLTVVTMDLRLTSIEPDHWTGTQRAVYSTPKNKGSITSLAVHHSNSCARIRATHRHLAFLSAEERTTHPARRRVTNKNSQNELGGQDG